MSGQRCERTSWRRGFQLVKKRVHGRWVFRNDKSYGTFFMVKSLVDPSRSAVFS